MRSSLRWAGTLGLLASLLLSGCFDRFKSSKDNIEPPTELSELTSALRVDRLWSAKAGPGALRQGGRLAPAVAEGIVYVAELKGKLSAHDGATGRRLWTVETGQELSGGPSARAGLVVVGSLDGKLFAYASDGTPRWDVTLSSEIIAPPAIDQGIVVVQSNDGRTFALEQDSGAIRWVVDRAVPTLSLRGNASPIIGESTTFIGQANGKVTAVNNTDGNIQWEYAVGLPDGRTDLERMIDVDGRLLLIQGDLFVAGYGSQAIALASESGRVLWNREFSSYTGFDLSGPNLVATNADGEVINMATRTGSPLWRQDALKYRFLSTPVVQSGHAVVGDYEGYLHWLDLESGEIVARTKLGKKGIRAAPVVADGVLYALDLDGTLAAYRAPGG
jgi:outer membrane protein assembly factor BamB